MSQKDIISHQPGNGLCYDPANQEYWSLEALHQEVVRIFEICHGCRLCFKYCDTFTELFALLDEKHDGDVRRISAAETEQLFEHCFQCKLCDVQCPYSPRDNHPYQLDFPRLVHRYRAIRTQQKGLSFQERVLANPDRAGRLARSSMGLANLGNRLKVQRWLLEKTLGIHRRKLLPDFARTSFDSWAARAGRIAESPGCEAVLFQTCFVQHNQPQIGRDTLEVLERNGVDAKCVRGLRCCGMPAWEKGDIDAVRAQAKHNLHLLLPFVVQGAKVIVINPTCSMMLRSEYPTLVAHEDRAAAVRVASAVVDAGEFLWSLRQQERFNTRFLSTPNGVVCYHVPCHLRAQAIGFPTRHLLKKIPGVKLTMVQECCGHDGTFAMTVQGFEASKRIGRKAFTAMQESDAVLWTTDCPLASLQFKQHAGRQPLHPMSILAQAYRSDGFPDPVSVERENR